ncbi:MAG TPA: GNAT family N-acetyltransferase [Ilumatobacteraceae bacterium]|nr:GNAT family N-acetyltransferase [Ilumatobacteraceae bacterium]
MPVRLLTPTDLDRVLTINESGVPGVGPIDAARLEHLVDESCMTLVATVDGPIAEIVAGFCIVLGPGADYGSVNYRWFSERYDDFVYLDRVAIAPEFQGRGLGRALYDEVERRAEAAWFTLEVNLRPRNDGSLAFHERLGFVEVGQLETDYGYLVSLMAKPLP